MKGDTYQRKLRAKNSIATITAHHLYLTTQHSCNPFAFCKPIPKTPLDRDFLVKTICSGESKFFL